MSFEEYSDCETVAGIIGLKLKKKLGQDLYYTCPSCGKDKLVISRTKPYYFHCLSCDMKGNYQSLYSQVKGVSGKQAWKEIHEKMGTLGNFTYTPKEIPIEEPIASIEVRDLFYRGLLSLLPLSARHIADMEKRGLKKEEIAKLGYGSCCSNQEATKYKLFSTSAEAHLLALVKYCLQKTGLQSSSLAGVPGVFLDKKGNRTLAMAAPSIAIPMRDIHGRIQAIHLRRNNEVCYRKKDGTIDNKIGYITSSGREGGTKAKTFLSYHCDFITDFATGEKNARLGKEVLFTEGPMKGDIIHIFTGMPCVDVPGVACLEFVPSELQKMKERGVSKVIIVYDMDYLKNKHVEKACKKLEDLIKSSGLIAVRRTWNPEYKGYDDFLKAVREGKEVFKVKDIKL